MTLHVPRSLEALPHVAAARVAMPWRRKLFACLAAGLPVVGALSLRCADSLPVKSSVPSLR